MAIFVATVIATLLATLIATVLASVIVLSAIRKDEAKTKTKDDGPYYAW